MQHLCAPVHPHDSLLIGALHTPIGMLFIPKSRIIGVAKPGHTRGTARASLINAPASASYLIFFKPGARRPVAGVRLVSRNHFRAAKVCVCVCVCVCVHPRGYK